MQGTVVRRTFEAARHPVGSAERARLNCDCRTSEYMPRHPYAVVYPNEMYCTFRTEVEAKAANK